MTTLFYRVLYRPLMRLAHRYNWHYAPPTYPEPQRYPEGDVLRWCHWCGMRDVTRRYPLNVLDVKLEFNSGGIMPEDGYTPRWSPMNHEWGGGANAEGYATCSLCKCFENERMAALPCTSGPAILRIKDIILEQFNFFRTKE